MSRANMRQTAPSPSTSRNLSRRCRHKRLHHPRLRPPSRLPLVQEKLHPTQHALHARRPRNASSCRPHIHLHTINYIISHTKTGSRPSLSTAYPLAVIKIAATRRQKTERRATPNGANRGGKYLLHFSGGWRVYQWGAILSGVDSFVYFRQCI